MEGTGETIGDSGGLLPAKVGNPGQVVHLRIQCKVASSGSKNTCLVLKQMLLKFKFCSQNIVQRVTIPFHHSFSIPYSLTKNPRITFVCFDQYTDRFLILTPVRTAGTRSSVSAFSLVAVISLECSPWTKEKSVYKHQCWHFVAVFRDVCVVLFLFFRGCSIAPALWGQCCCLTFVL